MVRSPLTLAALATSAVVGLDVTAATRFGGAGTGDYAKALLDSRDGRKLLIRVPRTQSAANQASADLAGLRALSAGVRGRLPFAVHSYLGEVSVDTTRAIVYDFLPGNAATLAQMSANAVLTASVGRSLAAIHSLPTSFIVDAGLPVVRPLDALAAVVTIMDRATNTGLIPAALLSRWERATEDPALWQFAPTVINGSLTAASFLQVADEVTSVVGWAHLSVGDPARDLCWTLSASTIDASDGVFDEYNKRRGSSDRQVKKRAMLYAELELAKWLLHGTEVKSTRIVDDAVVMLHNVVDFVQNDLNRRIDTNTRPVLNVSEVEELLDRDDRKG
ncbi:MAG: phosphotransferase [Microbacteriaceae bacterium]|nr:phosphotransferase [Microbacteriaceae bacterium]